MASHKEKENNMNLLDMFRHYIGPNKVLQQSDGDQGDSAQREGMLAAGAAIWFDEGWVKSGDYVETALRVPSIAALLVSNSGKLRRSPDEKKWYGEWNRGSRDQYHYIIGLAFSGAIDPFMALLRGHAKRLFLVASNTRSNGSPGKLQLPDITGPNFWSLWVRGANILEQNWTKWFKPFLYVGDLSLVINSLIRVYWYGKDKEESDCLNHVQALTLAHYSMPTFLSRLAARIMRGLPKKWDNELGAPNAVQQEFNNYFGSNGGITPMALLWAPIIEKVVYGKG